MIAILFSVHHLIRPIWSLLFNIFYFIPVILFKFIFNKTIRYKILKNRKQWLKIGNLTNLQIYFENNKKYYIYKWDGYKGYFDHDNIPLEFYDGGDCDDMGNYSKNKLKKLGYEAIRIGLVNFDRFWESLHYDCLFIKNNKYYLFNYGSLIEGESIQECIDKLGEKWKLFKGNTKYWFCLY